MQNLSKLKFKELNKALSKNIKKQNSSLVEQLLKLGANPNHTNKEPLYLAISQDNLSIIQLLVQYGSNFKQVNLFSFFCEIIQAGHLKTLDYFLDIFPELKDSISEYKNYYLDMACSFGHVEIAKTLISYGADFSYCEHKNIRNAIYQKFSPLTIYLLSFYSDVSSFYGSLSDEQQDWLRTQIKIKNILDQYTYLEETMPSKSFKSSSKI